MGGCTDGTLTRLASKHSTHSSECAKVKSMRTSLWTLCVTALAASILFPRPTLAQCAPGATSFCQNLPDGANKNSAIFLGIVKQVVIPTRTLPPPLLKNQPSGAVAQARPRVGDPIPSIERKYPTARFQVLESFVGAEPGEFEVRMTSDHFINGIPQQVPPFAEGEIWLVEAYRDLRDQQWTTSFCQRTKPAVRAEEDLRVLRAWVGGQRLPARFDGEVFNPTERRYVAGVGVYLRGEKQIFSTITDSGGHFAFENLTPGIYEAAAMLPQGEVQSKSI